MARADPGVPWGPRGRVYVGTSAGSFYCLAVAGGKPLWSFRTGGEITGGCNFVGGGVLVGSLDKPLYCLDEAGTRLWSLVTGGPVNGSPAVSGDTVLVAGCDRYLRIVQAVSGKELAAVGLDGEAAATPAVSGDLAYVGTMANQVVCVDWKNRRRAWSFEAAARRQPFYGSPAVTESLVIAGGRDRKIRALDRRTGRERWDFATDAKIDGAPVAVGGRVYFGTISREGYFYALDLATGRQTQEIELDSAVTGSVAVGPDCILVGTERGTVYCLGSK